MDSDFTVGFKQGQEHGKQIILEKVNEALKEIHRTYCFYQGSEWGDGIYLAKNVFMKHLGEELEHAKDNS